MRLFILTAAIVLGLLLAACVPIETPPVDTPDVSPTPVLPETPTPVDTPLPGDTPTPVETPIPELTPTPEETPIPEISPTPLETPITPTPERPEESIFIREPASGSRVTSPIRVAGVSDPTFEQTLVVRLLLADGTEVSVVPAIIDAELGQRGDYEVEVPVDLAEETNIFIQVFASSARDGGITHLNSVGVIFIPTGPEEIITATPHPEQIAIFEPQLGDTISGGVAFVEGFGLASFEQALLVQVLDEEGNVIGEEPIIVQAPDLGFPGTFTAEVSYTVTSAQPGRIVVRDISPAHGDDSHLSSVEVNLEP